jgi:hypothetical protein
MKAKIAYGVVAGVMSILYLIFVVLFEIRRKRTLRGQTRGGEQIVMARGAKGLPTYEESEESVGRGARSGSRSS